MNSNWRRHWSKCIFQPHPSGILSTKSLTSVIFCSEIRWMLSNVWTSYFRSTFISTFAIDISFDTTTLKFPSPPVLCTKIRLIKPISPQFSVWQNERPVQIINLGLVVSLNNPRRFNLQCQDLPITTFPNNQRLIRLKISLYALFIIFTAIWNSFKVLRLQLSIFSPSLSPYS
jgi:hypothetical protein